MKIEVPPIRNQTDWPSLGPQVQSWMEDNLTFGPGDLYGQPYRLDKEKSELLRRMYEVHPHGSPQAGRRRFKRCAIVLRKGSAKTEFSAAIAAAELAPDAPVRTVGWTEGSHPLPIGGPVTYAYIPLLATTREQSEELAVHALTAMTAEVPNMKHLWKSIERTDGSGKAEAVSGSPKARDGSRVSFQLFDETHRLTLPRELEAHRVMLANCAKRKGADAWSLEVTTAFGPGEGSVAEQTHEYARLVKSGKLNDSSLFYFMRSASDDHDLDTTAGLRAAILEASGPVAEWSDTEAIVGLFQDPTADRTMLERLWLNRLVRGAERGFNVEHARAVLTDKEIEPGRLVVLGFDGARTRDSTALVAVDVETGHMQTVGLWERPPTAPKDWTVDTVAVDAAIHEAFDRWDVWRLYADPPYWQSYIDAWSGEFGKHRVVEWWTNRWKTIAYAIRAFDTALSTGEMTIGGEHREDLVDHLGNAVRKSLNMRDDEGNRLWVIQKERPDSPHKIDAAMAAILAWEARGDAVASGAGTSAYEAQGENASFLAL